MKKIKKRLLAITAIVSIAIMIFIGCRKDNFVELVGTCPFTVGLTSNPVEGGTTNLKGSLFKDSVITIGAISNPGYRFTNWTNGTGIVSAIPNYEFTLTKDTAFVANFVLAENFTVGLSSIPSAGGTTTGNGSFFAGDSVIIGAKPNNGYTFTNWTNGEVIASIKPDYKFKLTKDTAFVANFAIVAGNLTVGLSSNPLTGGTITGGGSFAPGPVTIVATPNDGYTFVNWTNGTEVASTTPTFTFTLTKDTTFVANFASVAGNLNVGLSSIPPAGGTITGGGSFLPNTPVTITATPNDGYTFTNWTNGAGIASTTPTLTFTLTKDTTFVANFAPIVIGANCPPVIDLGFAGNFTIFAESGISATGATGTRFITGDIGVNPVKAIGITGFNLDLPPAGAFSASALVDGNVYAPDYYPPTPAYVVTTTTDMEAAYTTAYNLTTPVPVITTTGDISGLTLTPGIYKTGTGLLITAAGVTLDGGGDDCATFIFQVAGGLTVANAATIHLQNGAQAKNIFWVVAGTTALGTTVEFNGNILCKTGIAVLSGAKITGRLLAQTAVTLDGGWVVKPQ